MFLLLLLARLSFSKNLVILVMWFTMLVDCYDDYLNMWYCFDLQFHKISWEIKPHSTIECCSSTYTLGCEKLILEKTSWNKSLYFHENLQNELSYIKIGPQIKKVDFFYFYSIYSKYAHHKTPGRELNTKDRKKWISDSCSVWNSP